MGKFTNQQTYSLLSEVFGLQHTAARLSTYGLITSLNWNWNSMSAMVLLTEQARAAIFWGSDRGKELLDNSFPLIRPIISTIVPPLFLSIGIQCVNQPIVRASITLQNPESDLPNIRRSVQSIYNNHGLKGLWHGTVRYDSIPIKILAILCLISIIIPLCYS